MKEFFKKHMTAILVVVAIALVVALVVGMVLLHGGKKDPTFATYPDETTPEVTISDTTGPDPIVNPSTGPNMQQPDVTIPAVTGTLPGDSFGTNDGTGTTAPGVTEPEVTTPAVTTPAPTTPKATEPTPTTPKPTEPVATTPKPTEPVATTPKATAPGHTHSYTGKVTKQATCTASGTKTFTCSCGDTYTEAIKATGHNYTTKVVEPTTSAQGYTLHTCGVCGDTYKDNYTDKLPEETKPSDRFGGVTPSNISVSNTAGWSSGDFRQFSVEYWDTMTNDQKRAYWVAYYDGYDCGVTGHNCKNANEHRKFTVPCSHCGLTLGCVGRIRTDELGFTYCDEHYCYSYDIKTDPSYYCQYCGKPRTAVESDPTKYCSYHFGSGTCGICGVEFSAGCHTCKQSDIDNYTKN